MVFASGSNALPVKLARFEGTAVESGESAGGSSGSSANVRLTWQTASETNNAGFEVQRKTGEERSGSPWEVVGYRESKADGGTTNQPMTYRFVDESGRYR